MKFGKALSAVAALVATVALMFVGGVYDYSADIVPGTLLTDLALMLTASVVIAIGAVFAFRGARWALRAAKLIKG
jgi:hypothetical protein